MFMWGIVIILHPLSSMVQSFSMNSRPVEPTTNDAIYNTWNWKTNKNKSEFSEKSYHAIFICHIFVVLLLSMVQSFSMNSRPVEPNYG
jgi:hypothetical protein